MFYLFEELNANLKDKTCQWMVKGQFSTVRFDGALKGIDPGNGFWAITAKVKGAKSMSISVDHPVVVQKDDTERMLRYKIFHNDELAIMVGFLKG